MNSNALRHIGLELYGEKYHKTSGGNMNRVLNKRKELLAILFAVALLGFAVLFRSTSYAAVGDIITAENQRVIKGVTYPIDGAKVTAEVAIKNGKATLYNDKTLIITGSGSIPSYAEQSDNPVGKMSGVAGTKTLILGEGITSISSNVLYPIQSTVNLYVCDTMTSVGGFSWLPIENLRLGNNVVTIEGYTFSISPLSGGIEIPSTVTEIATNAFKGYKGESIVLPEGLIKLDGFADSKLKSITIPSTVTTIGETAFTNTEISSVTIPNGVESLSGFAGTKLTSINIPSSVTRLGSAFKGSNLATITGGENVEYIGSECFRGTQITSVPFQNIKKIMYNAFRDLTKVSINLDSLTEIGDNVFNGTEITNDINLKGAIVATGSITPFSGATLHNVTIDGVKTTDYYTDKYMFTGAVLDTLRLKNNPTMIIGDAKIGKVYAGNSKLGTTSGVRFTKTEIADIDLTGVTDIEERAFTNAKFTNLDIPDTVTSIGNSAFMYIRADSVTLPKGEITAGTNILYSTNIGNLRLGDTVSESMLSNSTIGTIEFGEGLTSLGKNSLKGAIITDKKLDFSKTNLSEINDYALSSCGVNEILLPDTVTRIGLGAFNGGLSLTSLNLTDNLTWIGTGAFEKIKISGDLYIGNGITNMNSQAFKNAIVDNFVMSDSVKIISDEAFYGISVKSFQHSSNITTIGTKAFYGSNLTAITIPESVTSVYSDAFNNCLSLKTFITKQSCNFNTLTIKGCTSLTKLVILSPMDPASVKTYIPSTAMVFCEANSSVETWCKNNAVAYKVVSDSELEELIEGKTPTLKEDSKMFDFNSPSDLKFKVTLGVAPSNATDITKLLVDNNTLVKDTDYIFNGTDTITIKASYIETLYNGTHSVSVLFNNGTFKSGASIYIMSSTVPVIDPTKPPVALDTVKYEFYKDYPDYLIIPVSLNGAISITKLKIGSEVVDPDEYYLDDGAIVISYNYLSTLDAGKYRILPTFDDPAITTLNNIQLWVYENAADRAAPYLLQTRIIFRGQNFGLRFDAGVGDLEASNVLALVIDNQMLLPDGRLLPLSSSNISKVKKIVIDDIVASPSEATRKSEDIYTVTPEEINTASPSEATNQTLSLMSSSMHVMSYQPDEAFYVVDNEIYVSGKAITSMKLAEGDHLIGAVFDNTENTSDFRKVILSIMSDKDNGTDTPGDNETPGNSNGSNNGGNSSSGGNSGSGSHGSNSGVGGSGSGDSSNGSGAKGEDSKVKPVVRDDGGSYNVNPNDPKDVTYTDKEGNFTPNKWVGDGQNWRHTNKDSKLDYGWFLDTDGNWYLLTKETGKDFGTARYGWFHESQDDKWYYLSTKDNKMAKGKVKIDGQNYNFNATNQEPTYYGDNKNGWIYDKTKGLPVGCWIEDVK